MNIINEYKFLLAYFICYACFEQQKLCCYNVAPSLACIKSKQSGDYTALSVQPRVKSAVCDRSFSRARFHATADRYRSFFSGWLQAHVRITCSSAWKTLKQQIHTSTHSVSDDSLRSELKAYVCLWVASS